MADGVSGRAASRFEDDACRYRKLNSTAVRRSTAR
jgi:hypothetical protein